MSGFFLDASALVKRYLAESGSQWIEGLTDPAAGHTLVIAEITRVEVAAAMAARHRAPNGISRRVRDEAVNTLLHHCHTQYQIVPLQASIISQAVSLTQNYRLRGYDAVQLATALAAQQTFVDGGLSGLTFITADSDLLSAAEAEGLPAGNPNHH